MVKLIGGDKQKNKLWLIQRYNIFHPFCEAKSARTLARLQYVATNFREEDTNEDGIWYKKHFDAGEERG
ncbi:hypothetical protein KSX_62280 [Ktedonospora formicarum]|uniref:Uncharacterized protein n=1 Tax=Ktedonospora formicarum TaxID=2778364 RepID=A0A8J3MWZ4_9CHLR|nr:hypothetical protein KSX_62280 [Ktedonospora formicarum]